MSVSTERKTEVDAKLLRLRRSMAERHIDAVRLTTIASTAWITAGAGMYVDESTDLAASSILVTEDRAYVVTDSIEAPRLQREEELDELGFEFLLKPWYAESDPAAALLTGKQVGHEGPGAEVDFSAELRHLRTTLQDEEILRLRRVSALAAEAMYEAIQAVRPGMSEYEAAARLAQAARERGGTAVVNLIASDERIYQYRHPLPTAKPIERYAMLVLSLRKEGFVPSITRLVHFGPQPEDLRKRAQAVARVDARMILGTRPGHTLGSLFELARRAYREEGYPEAIEEHHQGGSMGYHSREIIAHPSDKTPIEHKQAFAWNPSIRGVKSEDTMLVGQHGPEILTSLINWPMWDIEIDGKTLARPAILER
ncbi:MAG TPA: M24 family metallopeptidase [Ktedonobacteraceae bacterium]|nr:M24 family metallopeptidase [Ktedonobacteraceae bacterium]